MTPQQEPMPDVYQVHVGSVEYFESEFEQGPRPWPEEWAMPDVEKLKQRIYDLQSLLAETKEDARRWQVTAAEEAAAYEESQRALAEKDARIEELEAALREIAEWPVKLFPGNQYAYVPAIIHDIADRALSQPRSLHEASTSSRCQRLPYMGG